MKPKVIITIKQFKSSVLLHTYFVFVKMLQYIALKLLDI